MNKDINFSKIPSHFILIAVFMLSPILSCVVKELKYREKINGLYYDKIHRMGSILSISIKDIDTIS
ncbi:MAG: hypothetical protein ABL857_08020, partial [Rickettsiales bacterium]